jgi:hypothetical protein
MSKYKYIKQELYFDPNQTQVQVQNAYSNYYKVIVLNGGGSVTLTTWLGGCGLAFLENISSAIYIRESNVRADDLAPIVDMVEDVMKDITTHHTELRLNRDWPVKDVYFTLAFTNSQLNVGDTFGEFTKLINIHVNKAHGPRSIYTFHSSHP